MNVFILSTGRCGSTTFARACRHIDNYSSGHETRAHCFGPARLAYPPDHIESDNRLAWFLGRLERQFPAEEVFYVHLQRERQAVARSYARRLRRGMILPAWAEGVYLGLEDPLPRHAFELALDYVDTVTANIEQFLHGRENSMQFQLEAAARDLPRFWERIGAEGALPEALAEFTIAHNAGPPEKRGG